MSSPFFQHADWGMLKEPNSDILFESFSSKGVDHDPFHDCLSFDMIDNSRDPQEEMLNFPVKRVKESLQEMNYSGCSRGCSPALELKERHNIRRKLSSSSKAKTSKRKQDLEESSVVVLEDLGADYLEALLSTSADQSATSSTC
ncbi:hypothetical protein JHK82_053814 [Glycine max]|nr:hypothetical protein JHK85_054614 [Glycine max]KAG5086417.1 hypothetical protein JHK82_053814 [Glycine max]